MYVVLQDRLQYNLGCYHFLCLNFHFAFQCVLKGFDWNVLFPRQLITVAKSRQDYF